MMKSDSEPLDLWIFFRFNPPSDSAAAPAAAWKPTRAQLSAPSCWGATVVKATQSVQLPFKCMPGSFSRLS